MEFYGVDLTDPHRPRRSWRWMKGLIFGLISRPPALVIGPDGHPFVINSTRLGLALEPPKERPTKEPI